MRFVPLLTTACHSELLHSLPTYTQQKNTVIMTSLTDQREIKWNQ